jgi:hypothetical protein
MGRTDKNLTAFQKRAEQRITQRMIQEGFSIGKQKITLGFDGPLITLLVDSMEISIFVNHLEFGDDYLARRAEVYQGVDEDKVISDFCASLVFYLRCPGYRDKPSLTDWRSTWRWLRGKTGIPYPDVPSAHRNKNR